MRARRGLLSVAARRLALLLPLLVTCLALAHPLSQGALDVTVRGGGADVRARVTMEEVSVTDMLVGAGPAAAPVPPSADEALRATCERHAGYLAAHVHLRLDGRPLTPRVVRVTPPAVGGADATYEIEYRPASVSDVPAEHGAAALELTSDVLTGVTTTSGTSWEATYVVTVRSEGRAARQGLLLTATAPLTVPLDRDPADDAPSGLWTYLHLGVHHILTGYDHLLFVGALVLAAKGVWDLFKVVSAFTLAHTITLTLAALDVVRLPSSVVEPMIAASIVFVAVENVLWPERARGWGRLGVAFAFGLFHGLGFAGGLLDAMRDLDGAFVLAAIAAFSGGVEIGHQVVVLPLFGALTLLRRSQTDAAAQERAASGIRRWASSAISLAGGVYLVLALRATFGS